MPVESDIYARRMLEFVERLQKLDNYEDICREITAEMEWFGFSHVSHICLPGPGQSQTDSLMLNTRPRDYVENYIEKNHVVRDPVMTELRRNLNPCSWSEIRNSRDLNRAERTIMDEAREFGVLEGLTIPIISESGSISLFCPCGKDPILTRPARAALEIIGIYTHHALQRATLVGQRKGPSHTPLTPREREIMQWVAAGKTDEEIADILSIGTTTVTTHVENAKQKLDAFRRTYAVVQAIRYGEISL
jgi:LuxR family quorum sensing-dependent transcriptional regulator